MNKVIKLIVLILVIIEIIFSYLTIKSLENKPSAEINEIEISATNEIENNNSFAILLVDDNGNVTESSDRSKWPSSPYFYSNIECYDEFGEISDTAVSFDVLSKKLTLTTKKSVFCYIKFAKSINAVLNTYGKSQLETVANMQAREDTLRRFQGTNDTVLNNYICFGTKDKNICTSDTDKYMYRIVGIDTTNNQLKVIKKETLNKEYPWDDSLYGDATWANSTLNKKLNGEYFLTNTSGYPYVSETKWTNLIVSHDWKYSDIDQDSYSPYDTGVLTPVMPASEVFKLEKSGFTNGVNKGKSTVKIGMMHMYDFLLSGGNDMKCILEESASEEMTKCSKNWIAFWNNDTNSPDSYSEWTMSRWESKYPWLVKNYQGTYLYCYAGSGATYNVRPVFYLASTIQISGTGKIDDPYIITNV